MQYIGIIPARYASVRFPGKPLVEIDGVSMIQRVYQQACKSEHLKKVVVATDDQRIYDHAASFGNVVLTSDKHPSGTDRCFEAALLKSMEWEITDQDVIVNVQGDEPYIQPGQIDLLCKLFDNPQTQIATLIKAINTADQILDENIVKVAINAFGQALYFSRTAIPFQRENPRDLWGQYHVYYKHIGMYAYRMHALRQITAMEMSGLEKAEKLEQLRWLENGLPIQTCITETESVSVDTPGDLQKFK